ncbi:hypothetical protein [Kitasatospora sp. MAA4]|uniref:hypothetical protein n=1 Tax=Kitasatospora sp. MAA4 TaxID=3035093 RepID=UPI002474DCB8|nr:hypothetical protein [Kitasatospora sp. MAA4]
MTDREFLALVRRRPGMYTSGGPTFYTMAAFVAGYDAHAWREGRPLLDGLGEWLAMRHGKPSNLVWWAQIRLMALPDGCQSAAGLPDESESKAIDLMFQLLDDFLAEYEGAEQVE